MIRAPERAVESKELPGTQLLGAIGHKFIGHGYHVLDTDTTGGEDYSGFQAQVVRDAIGGRTTVFIVIPDRYPLISPPLIELDVTASPSSPVFDSGYRTGGAFGDLFDTLKVTATASQSLGEAVLQDVPSILQSARSKAGLPVQDLAAMFGIKRRQFYNLISGDDTPDPSRERRITRVTEIVDTLSEQLAANSRSVRAALLARLDGDSIFDAAVSGEEDRIIAAASRASAAIEHGVPRDRLAPSRRATQAEAEAVREFLRATRDDNGTSSES